MIAPPVWTPEELSRDSDLAIEHFRRERMQEPLEQYLNAFDDYQGVVEELLETTVDLTQLDDTALEVLCDNRLALAVRYLTGPMISEADLKTLAEAVLTAKRLRSDPEMVGRIVEVIRAGLDRRRFAWMPEQREPTEHERAAAILATARSLRGRNRRGRVLLLCERLRTVIRGGCLHECWRKAIEGEQGREGQPPDGLSLPQLQANSELIWRKFSARQTNVHSPDTFFSPLKLNCRNPSTDLIQPLTGSTMLLRFA